MFLQAQFSCTWEAFLGIEKAFTYSSMRVSDVGFGPLTAAAILWDITRCSPVKINKCWQARKEHEADKKKSLLIETEDGGDMLLRTVVKIHKKCMAFFVENIITEAEWHAHILVTLSARKLNFIFYEIKPGARGSVVVKALYYKPEDRGFEIRWGE
jgi:hypothetical protein